MSAGRHKNVKRGKYATVMFLASMQHCRQSKQWTFVSEISSKKPHPIFTKIGADFLLYTYSWRQVWISVRMASM